MYDWPQIELATQIMAILPAISVSAAAAAIVKRRSVFIAGVCAVLIASLGTGTLFPLGHSTGGRLDNLYLSAESLRENTLTGSIFAISILLLWSHFTSLPASQNRANTS